MPRLLVLGKEIPRLKCVKWDEWQNHNLLDYQALLIDCRSPSRMSGNQKLADLLVQFMLHGHKVFVILPQAADIPSDNLALSVLPYTTMHLSPQKGKTLIPCTTLPLIHEYMTALDGHEFVISPRATVPNIPNGWSWQTTVSDNVKRAVCGQFAGAYIFHPPAPGRDGLAVKAILDFFHPEFEEPEPEDRPDWAKDVIARLPGMTKLESASADKIAEIARLRSELEANEIKRLGLERWAEMLWFDGVPLQNRVSEALELLGIPNKSNDPTGHAQDLQGSCAGHSLLFEVTGSTGSIGVEKGRQLLQWMADCDDPTNTKGILIGNAFRKNSPDQRPPSPNHKIFVKELEEMATRFHFGLLDVRDVYDLVVRKLGGEDVVTEQICKALQADGVISFSRR